MRRKEGWVWRVLFLLLWIFMISEPAKAAEPFRPEEWIGTEGQEWERLEEMEKETEDLDRLLQEILGEEITFQEVVKELTGGNWKSICMVLGNYMQKILWGELAAGRKAAWQVVLLAVMGAIFTNLSGAFPDQGTSQTGFLILYMVLSVLLLALFSSALQVAQETLTAVGRMLTAFFPVFFVTVALQGQLTAAAMYELALVLMGVVEWCYKNILLRGVKVWVLLRILDGCFPHRMLSRLTGGLGKAIKAMVKGGLGLALGIQAVQALLLPYLDAVKGGVLVRLATALPGIGNGVETAAQTVMGTAALLRNGIGVGGVVCLLLLSAGPLIKLGFLGILYQGLAMVLQPVADRRFAEGVAALGEGCLLLWKLTAAAILLFCLMIGIACIAIKPAG